MKPESLHYVIVGASAAGMAAAEAIRRHDPEGSITVLSEEPDPPYFRPLIPFLISGRKSAEQMALLGEGPYSAGPLDLRLDALALGIDHAGRRVAVAGGDEVPYDRLLIATGSSPNIPAGIEGLAQEGVFAVRTLTGARRAARRAAKCRHAVMLGGGLLNLKTAFAFLERGLAVTLVVYSPEVLSQLMEPADARLIRRALDEAGLRIITGRNAAAVLGDDRGVRAVVLDDGTEIECGIVCIGKGVAPNTGWLESSAVRLDGGVVADAHTRTSLPDVFAAGDVAVTTDPVTGGRVVTGLWTNAVEMGRCAGANMAGRPEVYGGTFGILNATQVARMPFVSMGIVHTGGTDYEVHVASKPDAYRKIVLSPEGDRLVGAVFVGDISKAGLYRLLIRERRPLDGLRRHVLSHSLHYGHFLYQGTAPSAEAL